MDKIYREYADAVYKYLLSVTHDEGLSSELLQDTFLEAVKSIERYDGSCKISVWLCQIGKHLYFKHLRKKNLEIPIEDDSLIPPLPSAEDKFLENEEKIEILKKIHLLKEETKEIVYLRIFGDLSFKEIGLICGISENRARVTFYRGKEKLKGGFKDE